MSEWIEWHWTPEKPYPETLEAKVAVKLSDGVICDLPPHRVSFWAGKEPDMSDFSSWEPGNVGGYHITHYRVVEAA